MLASHSRHRPLLASLIVSLGVGAALLGACDKQDDTSKAEAEASKQGAAKQAEPPASEAPAAVPPAEPAATEAPAAVPPTATGDEGPVRLSFAAAKIMPAGKPELAVTLDAAGQIRVGDSPAAMTISPEGKVSSAEGKPVAELGPDGALRIGGRNSGIVLAATGLTLSAPDGRKATMVFNHETHRVDMDPPPGPGMHMEFEGCDGAVTRTCALVLALYLLAAN